MVLATRTQARVGVVHHGDRLPLGECAVHSRFPRCVNFIGPGGMVSLVDESIGAGPTQVGLHPFHGEVSTLVIAPGHLELDGLRLPLEGATRYDSTPHLGGPAERPLLGWGLAALECHLEDMAAEKSLAFLLDAGREVHFASAFERGVVARFRDGIQTLREGRLEDAAACVRGSGWGLTPSGDDFLYGLLVASYLADRVVAEDLSGQRASLYLAALGDNELSNHFLRMGRMGWLSQPMKQVVEALWRGRDLAATTRDLLAHGATSGADTAVGLVVGLKHWLGIAP